jgi:hypothetical protein
MSPRSGPCSTQQPVAAAQDQLPASTPTGGAIRHNVLPSPDLRPAASYAFHQHAGVYSGELAYRCHATAVVQDDLSGPCAKARRWR